MKKKLSLLTRAFGYFRRRLAKSLIHEIQTTPYFYGQNEVVVGKNVGLANTIFNARSGKIILHDNVIFGHNCIVVTGVHDVDVTDGFRPTLTDANRNIEIGKNVFVGSGSIIVGGPIAIGDNAVIGAGSIVVKDIPPGVLAVGNPARAIRTVGRPDGPKDPLRL